MILNCPSCQTRYAVPDNALGVHGRTVRCRKCKSEWFQEASQDAEIFDDFLDFDASSGAGALPALSEPASNKSWMFATLAMFFCVVAALLLHSRDSFYPMMPGVYEAMGYYPSHGVVLANVDIEAQKARRKKRFLVSCILLNTSDTPQIQPPVAMRILSAGGNVLAEDDAYLPGGETMIEPGKHVDCGDLEIVHSFASADKLMLEIASPLEMALRSGWSPEDKLAAVSDEH